MIAFVFLEKDFDFDAFIGFGYVRTGGAFRVLDIFGGPLGICFLKIFFVDASELLYG